MAINPLELQTLFSQVNNVGKMQANIKEVELLKQEIATSEINKKSEKEAEDVPETKNIEKDFSKITDKEKQNKKNKERQKNKYNKEDDIEKGTEEETEIEKAEEKKEKEPYLGSKIDILG